MRKSIRFFFLALLLALPLLSFIGAKNLRAAEGAAGIYPLGYQGGPLAGFLPPPGFYFRDDIYYYNGSVGKAVLQGKVNLGLDELIFGDIFSFSYISKFKVLGANYGATLIFPLLLADLNASLQGSAGGPGARFSQDNGGPSDLAFAPIILGWHHKEFNFIGQVTVFSPTGSYSINRKVNVSKHHWAFDPNFGFTWFDFKSGNEVSLDLGLTFNLENPDTDYRTGDEFHAEFQYNHHFMRQGLALGAGGYAYQQVSGDSGSGALLGPFKGTVIGLGPQISYATKLKNRDFSVNARYYREFLAKNRFEGSTFFVTFAYKLF